MGERKERAGELVCSETAIEGQRKVDAEGINPTIEGQNRRQGKRSGQNQVEGSGCWRQER